MLAVNSFFDLSSTSAKVLGGTIAVLPHAPYLQIRLIHSPPMQWFRQGAHYLLQTRTAVVNGKLCDYFEKLCPELSTGTQDEESEIPVKMAA